MYILIVYILNNQIALKMILFNNKIIAKSKINKQYNYSNKF